MRKNNLKLKLKDLAIQGAILFLEDHNWNLEIFQERIASQKKIPELTPRKKSFGMAKGYFKICSTAYYSFAVSLARLCLQQKQQHRSILYPRTGFAQLYEQFGCI